MKKNWIINAIQWRNRRNYTNATVYIWHGGDKNGMGPSKASKGSASAITSDNGESLFALVWGGTALSVRAMLVAKNSSKWQKGSNAPGNMRLAE